MFTEQELIDSPLYKSWVKGSYDKVDLIHNTYYDSKDTYASYIVVCSTKSKYAIIRFFKIGNSIQVSQDYKDKTASEVFKLLLSEYSRGLK